MRLEELQKEIKEEFNKFIESGILDENNFQEYEISILEFDNKVGCDKE